MAFTGSTFGGPVVTYLTPAQIAQDAAGWLLKDAASGSTTYYGYTITSTDQSQAVWKIRREKVAGTITTVTYADGDGNFDNVWANRASLTYK